MLIRNLYPFETPCSYSETSRLLFFYDIFHIHELECSVNRIASKSTNF